MKWSEDQYRAIYGDGAIVVSASAGSGKTTVMIERVLKMIKEGRDVEKLLVLTFTNAAAADMRDKLSRRLAKDMLNPELRETAARLAEQFNNLQSSKVSTLHSFCLELCRRFFYHLGIPGDVLPMTEEQAAPAAYELIEEMAAEKLYVDKDFTLLYFTLYSGRGDKEFRNAVWTLNKYAGKEEFPEKWLADAARAYENPKLTEEFNKKWIADRAAAIADELRECRTACGGYPKLAILADELEAALSARSRYGKRIDKRSFKDDDEIILEELRAISKKIGGLAEDADKCFNYGDLSARLLLARTLASFTAEFRARFRAFKEKEGAFEFSDFEHLTYSLLTSGVYSAPEEFDAVFVDEYQDISPIQDCLISALTGERDSFFVGDVKQSIYGFRLCRPEIFAGRFRQREGIEPNNAILLNENYRSNARILEFCNKVFSGVMTDGFGGVNYAKDALLQPGLTVGSEPDFLGIKTVLIERPVKEKRPPDKVYSVAEHIFLQEEMYKARAEAEVCADEIERLLGLPFFDGAERRTVAYSDFAVLSRTKESVSVVSGVLARRGIPCRTEKKEGGQGRGRELELINNYLKVIDNYRQDLPLIAVMKSRVYSFTDAELLLIRKSFPHSEYFHNCVYRLSRGDSNVLDDSLTGGIQKRLRELFNDLKRYGDMSLTLTAAELASVIAEEKEYFKLLAGEPDGEEKQRNLERYLALLESKNMPLGIYPFLEFLEKAEEDAFAPAAVPAGGDFVRVMTIHASKGLEFPIVLLTNTVRQDRDRNKGIVADRELGLGIDVKDSEDGQGIDIVRDTIIRKIRFREAEEELRILYVALTRARSALIMIGSAAGGKEPEGYFKWISEAAGAGGVTCLPAPVDTSDGGIKPRPVLPAFEDGLGDAFDKRLAGGYKHGQNHLTKTNVTRLTEAAHGGQAFRAAAFDIGETDEDISGERALLAGNAYHKYLELYDFSADPDEFLARITGSVLTAEESACIDTRKISILKENSGIKSILSRATRIYREKKFVLSLPASEVFSGGSDDPVLIQGVIDFLAICEDGAIIIDYKTTRAGENELIERYSVQLDIYARAVKKILKTEVLCKNIYSLYVDKLINIS